MGATLADPVQFLERPDQEAVIMSALAPGRSWTANMQRHWSLCRHLHGEGYGIELIRDCQRRFDHFSGRRVVVDLPAVLAVSDGRADFLGVMLRLADELEQETILYLRPRTGAVEWLRCPSGSPICRDAGISSESGRGSLLQDQGASVWARDTGGAGGDPVYRCADPTVLKTRSWLIGRLRTTISRN